VGELPTSTAARATRICTRPSPMRGGIGCNHNGEFLRMERIDYEDGKPVAVTLEPEGEVRDE
jgi:hypothetical protein